MKVFNIVNVGEFGKFSLAQKDSKAVHSLIMEFYGIPAPEVGDSILINEKLLDKNYEGYAQPYAFKLDGGAIRNEDTEKIAVHKQGKNYVLKRVYG